ncbi:hypothetical protein JOB18_035796 [Solea senegalensis]|uniref:Uncharacterized protein n=1 Tax=Solea senegalensis TaxID=28829 RepID=A0AAV6SSZ6_SOLSE|nr:uncharacterized protein LOC122776771 isoform X2 [Solea senegalensis]XP_043893407.1 uncharacterized protein LOC122776771 isoform X3 [Solea senegalensis]KAG7520756.1 hypothetical protein JOB18_035796 [Solea senegalensis]KAG7520758.1 hypothetical protein JOB18_035796 [Solea senegalensis]
MEPSEADALIHKTPPVEEDHGEDNRNVSLPSCASSTFASAVATFFIGLFYGAAGGLLLGTTAVVVAQSLELLADSRLLMDQLENYIHDPNSTNFLSKQENEHFKRSNTYIQMGHIHISLFALLFGLFSSIISLPIGIFIGFSTYALVIKVNGEAAIGKALTLAGTVCLSSVTAIGFTLGLAFESFLSFTLNVRLFIWFHILAMAVIGALAALAMVLSINQFKLSHSLLKLKDWLLTPIAAFPIFDNWRFILANTLFSIYLNLKNLQEAFLPKQATVTIPLMLIIATAFNMAGQPIITLQLPTSTNSSSVTSEAIFIGILTSQLLTVTVGMSLFLSWHRSGAGRICATAAGSGAAVLSIIKWALPALGPGASIGAVMGVTGAVGVSLSAAATATDHYGKLIDRYGLVGRLGVVMGAGVGAFLTSCAHSGLSGVFMGLCAATIPVGPYLKQVFFFLLRKCPQRICEMSIFLYLYCRLIFVIVYTFTHKSLCPFTRRVQSVTFLLLCVSIIPVGFCLQCLHSRFYLTVMVLASWALLIPLDTSIYDLVFDVDLIEAFYGPAVIYPSLLFVTVMMTSSLSFMKYRGAAIAGVIM